MPPFLLGLGSTAPPSGDPTARYPATDHAGLTATPSGVTGHTSEVSRLRYLALSDLTGPAPVYANFGYPDTDNPNSITIEAAIEYPSNTFHPLTFNDGDPSAVLVPGAIIEADPHDLEIPQGAPFFVRTGTTVAPGDVFKAPASTADFLGEGVERDAGTAEVSSGTITTVYGQFVNGPLAILSAGAYRRSVALVGDSNTMGLNVSRNSAFGELACIAAGVGYFQLGAASERASGVATPGGYDRRLELVGRCASAVVAYGTNDFINGRTFAQVRDDLLTFYDLLITAPRLQRIFACTVPPITTSTDGFITVVNQTPAASTAARLALNEWLVDGAPIDGTGAAVAVGAAGTRAGDPGHPLEGIFDIAAACAAPGDLSRWNAPGGTPYTNDGVHLTGANTPAAAEIDASLFA